MYYIVLCLKEWRHTLVCYIQLAAPKKLLEPTEHSNYNQIPVTANWIFEIYYVHRKPLLLKLCFCKTTAITKHGKLCGLKWHICYKAQAVKLQDETKYVDGFCQVQARHFYIKIHNDQVSLKCIKMID